ncbi:peptide-methionine (S)-S-oxide reductase MsrA [Hyalangium minutum]|uniref:Peptide methionine sulfoxide reductase MsrA n=1 Tax=Hyalangium minutum TaxID=394096 RepID=A0A085WSI6_9BACT|nr:peptide-methionine (S)-S-oxide reductase MsrA [Hyalangium minutum]KFE70649.1 Peptide methionine sulfoxide reductase MsrA [Hyalangium minutum]
MTSRFPRLTLLALAVTLAGAGALASSPANPAPPKKEAAPAKKEEPKQATALFAGGCFWSMESAFDKLPGVISATSGYTGGTKANPTYDEVSSDSTGHAEAVQIVYDPSKVTYAQLLQVYWHNVDPLTPNAQFCDHGSQYRSAIFFQDAEQQRLAEESKRQLEASGRFKKPIVTQLVAASTFYPAEDYHQDYAQKNPVRYRYYRSGCGRDARLKELWGDDAPKH